MELKKLQATKTLKVLNLTLFCLTCILVNLMKLTELSYVSNHFKPSLKEFQRAVPVVQNSFHCNSVRVLFHVDISYVHDDFVQFLF